MKLPTPLNPVVLTFRGHTPALKNEKKPAIVDGRIVPLTNKAVRKWMQQAGEDASRQWQLQQERHGFATILVPQRVRCVTYIHFYATHEDVIPQSDLDNASTTIQEMLQLPKDPSKPYIGVIENDRQIFSNAQRTRLTLNRKTQHAIIYLWVDDGRPEYIQEGELESNRDAITQSSYNFGSELPELLKLTE